MEILCAKNEKETKKNKLTVHHNGDVIIAINMMSSKIKTETWRLERQL